MWILRWGLHDAPDALRSLSVVAPGTENDVDGWVEKERSRPRIWDGEGIVEQKVRP